MSVANLTPYDIALAAKLIAETCERFGVPPSDVSRKCRVPAVVRARRHVALTLRDVHGWRVKAIANHLNQNPQSLSVAMTNERARA